MTDEERREPPSNDGTWDYTWEHGRQLASLTMGGVTWNYTYNADGLRTSRTNGTVTYDYTYTGDKLTYMTDGTNELYISYDANGIPMSLDYNGTTYYYVTNVQGDVIALVDSAGTEKVSYSYDAWGNPLSTGGDLANTLGVDNPLRYRSYVYDQETKLYYLQSRYYNPEIGRFINADGLVSTGQGLLGNNMFTYCNNNPVNAFDPNGMCSYSVYYGGAVSDISCYRCRNQRRYITDQDDEAVADKRLGIVDVGHAGCGPIALYNAAVALDLSISFDDVLAYYNFRAIDLYLLGAAGTPLELITDFFEAQGYGVICTTNTTCMDALSEIADASIMYYHFPRTYGEGWLSIDAYGSHFVYYSSTPNGYYAYNVSAGNTFSYPSEFATRNYRYGATAIFIFTP